MTSLTRQLARWRVPLGFLMAIVTLAAARPTRASLLLGLWIALVGEGVRVWAAGHLEKSREVTRSGPYRFTGHPLYVGSSVIALGVVIAANSLLLAVVVGVYMTSTLVAAVRTEEAFLHETFGETYHRYRNATDEPMVRRFSLARVMRNREYRAIVGLAGGFALLALRARVFL